MLKITQFNVYDDLVCTATFDHPEYGTKQVEFIYHCTPNESEIINSFDNKEEKEQFDRQFATEVWNYFDKYHTYFELDIQFHMLWGDYPPIHKKFTLADID